MLAELFIENVAIIKKLVINFENGLNVFTGETGAGKSIIVDAINLVMGKRGTKTLIRSGEESCFVSALFQEVSRETIKKLTALNYKIEQNKSVLITREFFKDAKNICRINGKPCTVSILKEISLLLININGQHDAQTLFNSNIQRFFIDRYGGYNELLTKYKLEFLKYTQLKNNLKNLNIDELSKQRQLDILEYQIKEIDDVALKPGEEETLKERKSFIQNSKNIKDSVLESITLINGNENFDGISSLFYRLEKCLKKCTETNKVVNIISVIKEMQYSISDIAQDLGSLVNDAYYDESEINDIECRLDSIYKLKRKYGNEYEDIMNFYKQISDEYKNIKFLDEKKELLQGELEAQIVLVKNLADEISLKRKDTAEKFVEKVKFYLKQLDMPNVDFKVDISEKEFDCWGSNDLEFLVTTNVGEPLKPLSKIASGGELSRIMLAIKNVLADNDFIGTMIFDEIDTGVSGNTAYNIGLQLKNVAIKKQVIVITHSAQIAAMAKKHLLITKVTSQNQTFTQVKPLSYKERQYELARILGGAKITDVVLKTAEEMLNFKG